MKFSIGDPVFVVSNQEEGRITEFIGNDMACIKTDTSTYHAYLSDLEHPYLRWFLSKKKDTMPVRYGDQIRSDKQHKRQSSLPEGFYIGFMPQFEWDGIDEQITHVRLYFFNQSDHDVRVTYTCMHQQNQVFQHQTELKRLDEFYAHNLGFEEISTNPTFQFQIQDKSDARLYLETELVLKPKKFFQFIDKLRHENKPIFHIPVFDFLKPKPKEEVYVRAVQKEKPIDPGFFNFEQAKRQQVYEVDLHIEKLVEKWHTLDASTMLHIQLTECQKALELAISTHQDRIIFIHGMGSGRLKKEVHLLLNQTSGVYKYVCDYDLRYGYGATEVFLKP